jgi:hypothetical protein
MQYEMGREEEFIQYNRTLRRTRSSWVDIIKLDFREIECVGVNCIE